MHEAFFCGPGNQRVLANYHAPAGGGGQVLTVLCPPLFSDYMRTHRALRGLAAALADAGQHVLRFDYRGTGDSFGELQEVTVSDWLEDVALVVREGREISGSSTVRLMGVRAGALLGCRSMGASSEVQRLVLWDPIPDGAGYLQALRRDQQALCERSLYLGRAERQEALHEYAGYALSGRMVEELAALDARVYAGVPGCRLHVVSTSSKTGFPIQGVSEELVPFRCDWGTVSDELIVPLPVLERLVQCLTRS